MKDVVIVRIIVIIILSCVVCVGAEVSSGFCGDGITWSVDNQNGTLRISGNGRMNDYSSAGKAPWTSFTDSITTVIIENGIEYIGDYSYKNA